MSTTPAIREFEALIGRRVYQVLHLSRPQIAALL